MDIIAKISEELGIKRHQTEAAVKLIDEGKYHSFYCALPEGGDRRIKR